MRAEALGNPELLKAPTAGGPLRSRPNPDLGVLAVGGALTAALGWSAGARSAIQRYSRFPSSSGFHVPREKNRWNDS